MPSKNRLCLLSPNYGSQTVFLLSDDFGPRILQSETNEVPVVVSCTQTMRSANDHPLQCDPFALTEIAHRDFAIRNV